MFESYRVDFAKNGNTSLGSLCDEAKDDTGRFKLR